MAKQGECHNQIPSNPDGTSRMREKETRLLLHRRHSPGNSSSFFCHSELEKSILADAIVRFIHLSFFCWPLVALVSPQRRERERSISSKLREEGEIPIIDFTKRLYYIVGPFQGEGEQFLVRIERMIDLLSCTSKMEQGRAVPPAQMQYRVCQ